MKQATRRAPLSICLLRLLLNRENRRYILYRNVGSRQLPLCVLIRDFVLSHLDMSSEIFHSKLPQRVSV
jgi:hypothetical protein